MGSSGDVDDDADAEDRRIGWCVQHTIGAMASVTAGGGDGRGWSRYQVEGGSSFCGGGGASGGVFSTIGRC